MLIIKFLSLLDKKQKIILFFITLFSFVAMLLETFSIALLLPLIDTIVNGNLNYNNIFFDYFIIETKRNKLVVVGQSSKLFPEKDKYIKAGN